MITMEIKYKAGHTISEKWEGADVHCPKCGEKKVWECTSGEDYYEGPQHICTACQCTFTLPSHRVITDDHTDVQRLEAIRKGE